MSGEYHWVLVAVLLALPAVLSLSDLLMANLILFSNEECFSGFTLVDGVIKVCPWGSPVWCKQHAA